jgi:hypothetical protein
VDLPVRPEMRIHDYPIINTFYKGSGPARGVQGTTDLYDRLEEEGKIYSSVLFHAKQGEIEKAKKLAIDNKRSLKHRELLNRASQGMAKLRQQQNLIYRSRVMSSGEKRDAVDKIQMKMNDLGTKVSNATKEDF